MGRRATGMTASNTDESFQRYIGEHSGKTEDLSSAMTFTTYMRRLTASIAALSLVRHGAESPPEGIERLARQLSTIHDAVERWTAPI